MSTDDTRPPERRDTRPAPQPGERANDGLGDRPSERPVTDPHGPGTTFFTNHPDAVVAREKDVYGGVRMSAVFFGWLSAVGLLTLLLALIGGIAAVVGLSGGAQVDDVRTTEVTATALTTTGVVAAALVLVAVLLAYLGGGYVAGRMARFDGLKQGLAVWLLALLVGVLLVGLGLLAGEGTGALDRAGELLGPRVDGGPDGTEAMTGGVVAAVVAALVALAGALLGGAAGTRYHRKVDRVGLLNEPGAGEAGPATDR